MIEFHFSFSLEVYIINKMNALTILLAFLPMVIFAFECSNFNSNMGATFDLSDLVRSHDQPPFQVEDGDIPCTKKVEKNYTYVFNVCGAVPSDYIPKKCKDVQGYSGAGALQVDKRDTPDNADDDFCFLVGAYSDTAKLTLLNPDDPTKGLKLTYKGDPCRGSRKPRLFQIDITCADKLNPVPLHAFENAPCEYTVEMPSVYGCPLECPVASRRICGGNGHCAYDDDKSAARCFCNNGYSGADCSQSTSTSSINYSPALLGLIITLFIIVAILVASIVYMVKQMNAYKEDLANYRVLKGSEDDSTTV